MSEMDDSGYIEIRALTDSGLREAIGGVCIHWALLELTVERVLAHLTGEQGLLRYEQQLGHNLKRLYAIAEASTTFSDAQKTSILELIAEAQLLSGERHRIAHGLWGKDRDGTIHSVFPAIQRNVEPMRPMTVEDIRQLKLRIFFLGKAFRDFVDPSDVVSMRWEKD